MYWYAYYVGTTVIFRLKLMLISLSYLVTLKMLHPLLFMSIPFTECQLFSSGWASSCQSGLWEWRRKTLWRCTTMAPCWLLCEAEEWSGILECCKKHTWVQRFGQREPRKVKNCITRNKTVSILYFHIGV